MVSSELVTATSMSASSAPAWRSFDPLMVLGPEDEDDRDWARAIDDQAAQDEMGIADVFDTRTGAQP